MTLILQHHVVEYLNMMTQRAHLGSSVSSFIFEFLYFFSTRGAQLFMCYSQLDQHYDCKACNFTGKDHLKASHNIL